MTKKEKAVYDAAMQYVIDNPMTKMEGCKCSGCILVTACVVAKKAKKAKKSRGNNDVI